MGAQLTVRLPEELDRDLLELAGRLRLKRSDIARMALERLVGELKGEEQAPHEKVKKLLGSVSSGVPDLGEAHRRHLLRRFGRHA